MHRHDWIRSQILLNDTVLEVGCAENPVFSGTSFRVTTLEKMPHPDYKPDVIGQAENLPFSDNAFDIVTEGELLEHVANPQAVISEAIRVAKRKVIFTVPDEYLWPEALRPFTNPGHVRCYTPATFAEDLIKPQLPFYIVEIRHGPWVWLGAELFKLRNSETVT